MIKYDKYKSSGVDWLGDIPKDWEVRRLKNIFSFSKGLTITKKDLFEEGVPCVNYGEIHSKYGFEVNPNKHLLKCVDEKLPYNKASLLSRGDFVFADTSEDIVGSGNFTYLNSDTRIFAGYHTIIAKPIKVSSYRYIAYLLDSLKFRNQIRSNVVGIKVYSITQGLLKRLYAFLPSGDEQTQIANYLDTKTQAIDKKINLLTQKANYYKEYRKSLINETVCKGLPSTSSGNTTASTSSATVSFIEPVEMKDSGIDWIGQIPKHWKVKRFKDICYKNTTGGTPSTSSPEHFNGKNTWVTIADLGNDKFVKKSKLGLTDEAIKLANIPITPKGSLIYSFKLTVGKIAFAKKDLYTNEALISIMPNKLIDLEYCYFMLPIFLLMNATENIYGAKMLNQKLISNTVLVYPPLSEQTQIAHYLDHKTQTIDKIVSNINAQITTLKELRKTLINDAVTGKIKVTNE